MKNKNEKTFDNNEFYSWFIDNLDDEKENYKIPVIKYMIKLREKAVKLTNLDVDRNVYAILATLAVGYCNGESLDQWKIDYENRLSYDYINNHIENKFRDCENYKDYFVNDYKKYLRTGQWEEIRKARLLIDDYECAICESRNNLQVHHIDYIEPNMVENLITLCDKCHGALHKSWDNTREILKEKYAKGHKQKIHVIEESIYQAIKENEIKHTKDVLVEFIKAYDEYNPYGCQYHRIIENAMDVDDLADAIRYRLIHEI